MARKFFYICAGLFLLAGAYALGARNVGAQVGGQIVGVVETCSGVLVITSSGDMFHRYTIACDGPEAIPRFTGLNSAGNFWGGGPIPAKQESFGSVKARYR